MTMKSAPVARFPSEMLKLLTEGSKNPVTVNLPTRRDCTRLRQKLYMLRAAMKREQHWASRSAERAEIAIVPVDKNFFGPDDPHDLIVRPANVEYVDALRKAGISADANLEPSADDTFEVPDTGIDMTDMPEAKDVFELYKGEKKE